LQNGEKQKLKSDSFDFLTELFVGHHTPHPDKTLPAAARILKEDGLAVFSARAVGHLNNMYDITNYVANNFYTTPAEPFYSYFDMFDLKQLLDDSPNFKIIGKSSQDEDIWVPDTDEGWSDYSQAFYPLLPLMKSLRNGQPLSRQREEVKEYLDNVIRRGYFQAHASYHNGYFTDKILQTYFLCEVVK